MKAIALFPKSGELKLIDHPEPKITHSNEVKIKVIGVGICGSDREMMEKKRAAPPPGEEHLILGHEMLGEVHEIGKDVRSFQIGDLAVITVRRGCNQCVACSNDRPDMCYLPSYKERGIKEIHGFQAEYVVDEEEFLVKVPKSLGYRGVLCEPMSVVEKAVEEILGLQRIRLPGWVKPEDLNKKNALVVGLGPIGLLACIVLKLRGLNVFAQDIVDPESHRVKIVKEIGGTYVHGKSVKPNEITKKFGPMEVIVEAAGVAELDFALLHSLSTNGGCVLTGIPNRLAKVTIDGGDLLHDFVLKNQVLLGSVNAGKKHWQLAVEDLLQAEKKWPGILTKLITLQAPYHKFKEVFSKDPHEEIKCVITWSEQS